MITAVSIAGGETYLSKHLSANDYYAEGEKVEGEWVGKGAQLLGLEGAVEAEHFEMLRNNLHPFTGERLTARKAEVAKVANNRTGKLEERRAIALHDITLSAPKAASIAAIVGGDNRVREAWQQSVRLAVKEMEHFAAVRLRTGKFRNTEKLRVTGNIVGALFFHDASRSLDPQLHAHVVMPNASHDEERGHWLALQRRAMLEASPYVREFLYHDFARRLTQLGYEIEPAKGSLGFQIAGITKEMEQAFSERARQRLSFEDRYRNVFGHRPSKRRIEQFIKDNRGAAEVRFQAEYRNAFGKPPEKAAIEDFVRDWRNPKLAEISTPQVRQQQRERLDEHSLQAVDQIVKHARERVAQGIALPASRSLNEASQMGLDHCLERTSVPRLGDALASALRFGSKRIGDLDPSGLYKEMRSRSGAISDGYLITTRQVHQEETSILVFSKQSRGRFKPLGDCEGARLDLLDDGQRQAIENLSKSRNGIAILIGDAGTGKTHTLARLDEAYRHATGEGLIALAPTTRATAELQTNGYPEAATVSAFLNSERLQEQAAGCAVLIDEAGFLSTKQLAELVTIANERHARLVLVGDTKQHESVERGNALRSVIDSGLIKPERLSDVRRQRAEVHRRLAKLLAEGKSLKALEQAEVLAMVHEIPDARELFKDAAHHYADEVEAGRETLVVIPTWEDIDWFNADARAELKARNLIHGDEVEIRGSASLSWTEVERCHWQDYQPGMVLNFHRPVAGMKIGESAIVREVLDNGVVAERPDGTLGRIGRKQRGGFDVAEERPLKVAAGDELLFRANCPDIGISNGERLHVESVNASTNQVMLSGGKVLPDHFTQVSHGHAVTSHKSQGASVQNSILVVGPSSLPASNLRQFYVSNTRFKEGHRLYAHDLSALKGAVANRSERMLAREFVAGLGKELGELLSEQAKARLNKKPSGNAVELAKQREARIKVLMKDVARHERRAQSRASFNALWTKLGVSRLPEKVQKWLKTRRQKAVHSRQRNQFRAYAVVRGMRKAHQIANWFGRARAGVRRAGRRR
ncbi:MAG: MobF family relaxase [Verrucomicrobiales bacterium]